MSARNLVDLVDRYAADELESMRRRFPEAASLLRWDRELGGEAEQTNSSIDALRALAESGQAAIQVRSEAIVAALSKRLRGAQRLKTWNAGLAAVANASLLTTFSGKLPGVSLLVQAGLAAVALAASVLGVFAERLSAGTRVNQLFDEALALSLRALRCDQTARRLRARSSTTSDWEALVAELDDLALEVRGLELKATVA